MANERKPMGPPLGPDAASGLFPEAELGVYINLTVNIRPDQRDFAEAQQRRRLHEKTTAPGERPGVGAFLRYLLDEEIKRRGVLPNIAEQIEAGRPTE